MKLHLPFLVSIFCAGTLCAQNPLTPQALPEPILSGKSEFRIPYQYDPAEIARLGAREIRLYASTNQGQQWQLIQSVQPQSGRFQFQAPGDGDYWFSVQTVDGQGGVHPAGQMQPGLIVRVDTTRPLLQLGLKPVGGGKVELAWNAEDIALDPNSLSFQYTQTGMTGWQQLPVQPNPNGQTSWTIPAGGYVAVRGSVRDKAGNETTSQATTQVPPLGANPQPMTLPNQNIEQPRQPAVPDPRVPIASNYPLLGQQTPGRTTNQPFNDPILQALPNFNNESPIPSGQPVFPPNQMAQQLPFDNSNSNAGINQHQVQAPLPLQQPNAEPLLANDPFRQDAMVSSSNPIQTNQVPYSTPQEEHGYRIVRTRNFNIDYRIDDIGPSGLGSVEMYVTQNNGEKWFRYGVDGDRRSPFGAEVPGDGIYGFSIRAVSGAGLTEEPPRPGDRPDIVVVVDSSPPVVRLFPLQQGVGPNTNKILITWQASDQKLADKPVALFYSGNPNGPWEPISDWQANSGQYVWAVGQGVPARLYVRLTARDAAGNLRQVDTPQPVLVDLAKPTARIVDIDSTRIPN